MDKLNSDYELSIRLPPPPIIILKCSEYFEDNEEINYCSCIIINYIVNKLSPVSKKK